MGNSQKKASTVSWKKRAHLAVDPPSFAEVDPPSIETIEVTNPSNTEGPDTIPLCDRDRPLFCKSNRGSLKLMHKGFGYNFRSARGGNVSVWICDKRAKYGCSSLLESSGDIIIKEPVHSHAPDWKKFQLEYDFAQKNNKY